MKQIVLSIILSIAFNLSYAQDLAPVTTKLLIKNAMIQTQPGAQPFLGHILVEDGIILQVGPSVQVPYDAKVVDGDSMYVYAGFIAPLSHIGLKAPKEDNQRPKVDRTGYPPNDVAGITPEMSIADHYDLKDGSIGDFRKQGFTISHSVPHGRMMPGMGSIISLNGASFNEAALEKDKAMFAQWKTANRVFPGTIIGIMSKWRELYRNAEIANKHVSSYKSNPRNRKRPSQDAATEALFPVVTKEMPVFFTAETHMAVYRTLRLKKDLGFNLVIAEAKDVNRVLGDIKSAGASVLLSLDLPDADKEKKEEAKDKTSGEKKDADKKVAETKEKAKDKKKDDDPKTAAMKARKSESIKRYTSQAKMMRDQGMPVAFSYLKVKAKEVHPNIQRMIAEGLSSSDALGALTTQPAATLGISDIAGTIEKGKLANLVMSTGPLFEEKTKIKMVMVDGAIHEYEVKEKKKKTSGDADFDASGTWAYTIEVPGMTATGSMIVTKNGDDYEVEITSDQNEGEAAKGTDIEMDGNNMTFTFKMPAGGMDMSIENDITFDGDSFEGEVTVSEFGSFPITGSKSTPE